jgi:hypothetical protein
MDGCRARSSLTPSRAQRHGPARQEPAHALAAAGQGKTDTPKAESRAYGLASAPSRGGSSPDGRHASGDRVASLGANCGPERLQQILPAIASQDHQGQQQAGGVGLLGPNLVLP